MPDAFTYKFDSSFQHNAFYQLLLRNSGYRCRGPGHWRAAFAIANVLTLVAVFVQTSALF
jgi:hypothetical protein